MKEEYGIEQEMIDYVISWPGVSAGEGKRGEFAFKVEGREIGHLHGDRVAHFYFPRDIGAGLRQEGRVGLQPVNPDSPKLASRTIRDQSDVEIVIALMRSITRNLSMKPLMKRLCRPCFRKTKRFRGLFLVYLA